MTNIGVLKHTLFGRTKSTHHPPGCYKEGVCEMNRVWRPRIRKGERIYEHENENANVKYLALLRDVGWLDADNGVSC